MRSIEEIRHELQTLQYSIKETQRASPPSWELMAKGPRGKCVLVTAPTRQEAWELIGESARRDILVTPARVRCSRLVLFDSRQRAEEYAGILTSAWNCTVALRRGRW